MVAYVSVLALLAQLQPDGKDWCQASYRGMNVWVWGIRNSDNTVKHWRSENRHLDAIDAGRRPPLYYLSDPRQRAGQPFVAILGPPADCDVVEELLLPWASQLNINSYRPSDWQVKSISRGIPEVVLIASMPDGRYRVVDRVSLTGDVRAYEQSFRTYLTSDPRGGP